MQSLKSKYKGVKMSPIRFPRELMGNWLIARAGLQIIFSFDNY